MIHVRRTPPPAHLYGRASAGGRERSEATVFYGQSANKHAKFPFDAYKHATVKAALNSLFQGKCAYCEAVYDNTQPVDIEHYRPKGGYASAKKLEVPGYYWLAAEWSNLLPSCIDCNRAREQPFERVPDHLAGKANQFPLKDESRRAKAPGEERHEPRLLLDPCRDQPEKHLAFDEDGHVDPVQDNRGQLSPNGIASIEVYGLDRDATVRGRRRVLKKLLVAIDHVERSCRRIEEYPDDPSFAEDLASDYRELDEFADPESEYAQMCRQVIERFEERYLAEHGHALKRAARTRRAVSRTGAAPSPAGFPPRSTAAPTSDPHTGGSGPSRREAAGPSRRRAAGAGPASRNG